MAEQLVNGASTTLAASMTTTQDTLVVTSTAGLPTAPNFALLLDGDTTSQELVEVTSVSGNTYTVTRASEAIGGVQTAFTHASGGTVAQVLTVQGLTNYSGALDQANTWSAPQTFQDDVTFGSQATFANTVMASGNGNSNYVLLEPNMVGSTQAGGWPFIGVYDASVPRKFGITTNLGYLIPAGYTALGGWYAGLGIQGEGVSTHTPIFSAMNGNQGPNAGIGNVPITVYADNTFESFNNTLDDGSGNVTVAGAVNVSGTNPLLAFGAAGLGIPTAYGTKPAGMKLSFWGDGNWASGIGTDVNYNQWAVSYTQFNYYSYLGTATTGQAPTRVFTIDGTKVTTANNTLDDGSGNVDIIGTLKVPDVALVESAPSINAGVITQSGNTLYIGNGTTANPIGASNATTTQAGSVEVQQTTSSTPKVSTILASTTPSEVEITGTTAQTVLTTTLSQDGQVRLSGSYRLSAAAQVTLTFSFTDGSGTAQTATWYAGPAGQAAGVYPINVVPTFYATTASAVAVQVTCTVANTAWFSGVMEGV